MPFGFVFQNYISFENFVVSEAHLHIFQNKIHPNASWMLENSNICFFARENTSKSLNFPSKTIFSHYQALFIYYFFFKLKAKKREETI